MTGKPHHFLLDGALLPISWLEEYRAKWHKEPLSEAVVRSRRDTVTAQDVIVHLAARPAKNPEDAALDIDAIRRITLALNEICGSEEQNGK